MKKTILLKYLKI